MAASFLTAQLEPRTARRKSATDAPFSGDPLELSLGSLKVRRNSQGIAGATAATKAMVNLREISANAREWRPSSRGLAMTARNEALQASRARRPSAVPQRSPSPSRVHENFAATDTIPRGSTPKPIDLGYSRPSSSEGKPSDPSTARRQSITKRMQVERTDEQLSTTFQAAAVPGSLILSKASKYIVVNGGGLVEGAKGDEDDASEMTTSLASTALSSARTLPKSTIQQFIVHSQREHERLKAPESEKVPAPGGNRQFRHIQPNKFKSKRVAPAVDDGMSAIDTFSSIDKGEDSRKPPKARRRSSVTAPASVSTFKITAAVIEALDADRDRRGMLKARQELKQVRIWGRCWLITCPP